MKLKKKLTGDIKGKESSREDVLRLFVAKKSFHKFKPVTQ